MKWIMELITFFFNESKISHKSFHFFKKKVFLNLLELDVKKEGYNSENFITSQPSIFNGREYPENALVSIRTGNFKALKKTMFKNIELIPGDEINFKKEYALLILDTEVSERIINLKKVNTNSIKTLYIVFNCWILKNYEPDKKCGELFQDTVINGISFGCGSIGFYEDGNVSDGYLRHDTLIQKILFTSYILLYRTGNVQIGYLARDTKINGINFQKNSEITFDIDGNVETGYLAQHSQVQGIIFNMSSMIRFHENKNVKEGVLAQDTFIHGILFKAKSTIYFYKEGNIHGGNLVVDSMIKGIKYKADTFVFFFDNGIVSSGGLAQNIIVNDIEYKANSGISFHENGVTKIGTLAQNTVINEIEYRADSVIEFDENQNVKHLIRVPYDRKIKGIIFKVESSLKFHANGNVKEGIIAKETIINGRYFQPDISLEFDENGKVKGIIFPLR
jgi:hypothetical protein